MRRLRSSSFCVGLWLIACASLPTKPFVITDSSNYADWWLDVEHCTGDTMSMSRVTFMFVTATRSTGIAIPGIQPPAPGYLFTGVTYANHDGTYRIIMGSPWVADASMVRHEMAHAITHVPAHPPEIFQRKCRGLVSCYERCLTDTTSLPPRR